MDMRPIPSQVAVLGLAFGLGGGCDSGGAGGDGGGRAGSEWLDAITDDYRIACECYAEVYGYDAEEYCDGYYEYPPGAGACIDEMISEFPEAGPILECETAVIETRTECISAIDCVEGDYAAYYAIDACFYAFIDGLHACPDIPGGAEEALEACLEGEEFECVDGSATIPGSYVCDGYDDCADGSDEANCGVVPEPPEPTSSLPLRFHTGVRTLLSAG